MMKYAFYSVAISWLFGCSSNNCNDDPGTKPIDRSYLRPSGSFESREYTHHPSLQFLNDSTATMTRILDGHTYTFTFRVKPSLLDTIRY